MESLDFYCDIIAGDSLFYSDLVRKEIIETTDKLSKNPFKFQVDEYYSDSTLEVRRFFRWSYRVVYLVKESRVMILNVFHTSKHPTTIK
ncbi:ParE toxin of type II toxin-antitoxin system, parDE [Marivirga sericea]|uniref:ParE toxin of type II toxin-antitoxin system, parDE n=2 Tax=Marivirga sericea TaxID=1028 RepID=A0A1X7LHZ4_9BACT|nr:ParE toxin of type II toxin-antitoxin system, parDE [Marivirga sericea]